MFDIHDNDRYCELLSQGIARNEEFMEKEKLRKEKLEEFKPILSILNDICDKLNNMNDKVNDIYDKVNNMHENNVDINKKEKHNDISSGN